MIISIVPAVVDNICAVCDVIASVMSSCAFYAVIIDVMNVSVVWDAIDIGVDWDIAWDVAYDVTKDSAIVDTTFLFYSAHHSHPLLYGYLFGAWGFA